MTAVDWTSVIRPRPVDWADVVTRPAPPTIKPAPISGFRGLTLGRYVDRVLALTGRGRLEFFERYPVRDIFTAGGF